MAFSGLDKLRLPEVDGEGHEEAQESTSFLSSVGSFFGGNAAAAPAAVAPAAAVPAAAVASSSWRLPWGGSATGEAGADVEAGTAAAAAAATEGGGPADNEQTGFFSAFRALAGTTTTEDEGMFAMGAAMRFQLFVGLMMMSMLFMGLAFTFLPLVVLRPAKFGFAFTMGSVLFMLAFAMLKGPKAYCRAQCGDREKIPATVAYWSSMLLTLWSCVVAQSYVYVVLSSSLMVVVMLWFSVGNLPGKSYNPRCIVRRIGLHAWPCPPRSHAPISLRTFSLFVLSPSSLVP